MPHARPLRTISAVLGTASLVALLSLSASPAMAVDAPWTAPVEVTDSYSDANSTVVAPDGTITVVSESGPGIVAAFSTDGGLTWSSTLVGSGGDYGFRPAIAVTSSGLLAATWVESLNNVSSLKAATSSDKGATWGEPVTLPATDGAFLDDPIVASTGASSFSVVWNEGFTKRSSHSSDGGANWGTAQVITENMNSYYRASLVPVGGSTIVAIFQEFNGNAARYSIQSRTSLDGGATWGDKVGVGSDWSGSLGNGLHVFGVSPSTGTLVAAWARGTETGDGLHVSTSSDSGASWTDDFQVASSDSLRYFDLQVVSPTAAGLAWHSQDEPGSLLSYATVAIGAAASSTPTTIASSPEFGFDRLPAFSALGDVRVASWFEELDDVTTSYANVSCDAGATWSTPVVLTSNEGGNGVDAQTVVSGGTFVAFTSQPATGPTQQSLFASTAAAADLCADVIPAGPTLAATGAPIAPTAILAMLALALGAGIVAVRRRSAA